MLVTDHHQAAHQHFAERDYDSLVLAMQAHLDDHLSRGSTLFRTDASGLFDAYLDSLPTNGNGAERQYHNCTCCRRFIEQFGGLVVVNDDGSTSSAVWPELAGYYAPAVQELAVRVAKARIVSPFLSAERTWGTPVTGEWTHFAVRPLASVLHRGALRTPGQAMAEMRERYRIVIKALEEFSPKALDEALRILKADAVARAEKFVAPIAWLRNLHDRPKGRAGENLLWRAIAVAPEGFCHPRSAVTGSLLEDIAAGMPFADIQRRFNAKMHPLQYQRPQAAPAAGTIRQAEAVVAQLGIARSLERRFARLDEVRTVWMPKADAPQATTGSVFGHLQPKNTEAVASVQLPSVTMTWEKFVRTVLPGAQRIRLVVPFHGRFAALLTAAHADAPPILKWDQEDDRYPVSWYHYHGGSPASNWGLTPGSAVEVTAIAPKPFAFGEAPLGFALLLEGAKDARTGQGNALFPETLRSELHGIRAVIEAYSKSAEIGGRAEASACGYSVTKAAADCHLRVFDGANWSDYRIDRWD